MLWVLMWCCSILNWLFLCGSRFILGGLVDLVFSGGGSLLVRN